VVIDDIIKFYLSEGMDKQILRKLPYALIPAIVLYDIISLLKINLPNYSFSFVMIISLAVVGVSTIWFLSRLNKAAKGVFNRLNLKDALRTFMGTYEKQDSLLSNIRLPFEDKHDDQKEEQRPSISFRFVLVAAVSGISTLIVLILTFFEILAYSKIGLNLSLVLLALVSFYLLFDLSKVSFIEEKDLGTDNTFAADFFKKFLITNSLARFTTKSKGLLYLTIRLVAPFVYVDIPKPLIESSFVYRTDGLEELFTELPKEPVKKERSGTDETKERGHSFYIQRESGSSAVDFFSESHESSSLSDILEQGPSKVFSYLLDPEDKNDVSTSSPSQKELAWISFKVLRSQDNSGLGFVVVHRFKNVFLMHRLKQRKISENKKDWVEINLRTDTRPAFQFIFIGERDILQYIKTQVDLNAGKVSPSALEIGLEP